MSTQPPWQQPQAQSLIGNSSKRRRNNNYGNTIDNNSDGDDDDSNIGDFIEDKSSVSPSDVTGFGLLKDKIGVVLSSLTERERKVLELRFGFGDGYARTLEEVGKQFNVTRERIRQIENQSLKKLQSLAEEQKLRDVA